jgi:ATP-binding cassette subfamily F protein 3
MSLIKLQDLTKGFDSRVVLRPVFFRLAAGDRVGLIGKNGSGKTTLLRLILGREEPTSGEIQREDGVVIGYFSQLSELQGGASVQAVLQELFVEVRATDTELGRIEERLQEGAPPSEMAGLLARQAELLERMEHLDGWTYQNRIDTVLTRLGFSETYRQCPLDQLSGGWRNRAALAKILLQNADVLLLDEPTNWRSRVVSVGPGSSSSHAVSSASPQAGSPSRGTS